MSNTDTNRSDQPSELEQEAETMRDEVLLKTPEKSEVPAPDPEAPGKVKKWVKREVANLLNTRVGIAYVPESLINYIPVYRAVRRENVGKFGKEEENIWFIGSKNRYHAEEIISRNSTADLLLLESTIGDLKKVGNVRIHSRGDILWVRDLKEAEPCRIVK